MVLRKLARILHAKQGNRRVFSSSLTTLTPKGYFSISVGESCKRKRFFNPLAYLNQPTFQIFLRVTEEEFGYAHPTGGLKFPCEEETFIELLRDITI
ncbi:Auxin responsive SAUR protein [Artemisia annua]|uniref:Auxin responsive SAUR protein n=1 Tax=Artemisia annua TaxID=35608 RepID=A0A2U1KHV3_ARTAN|nr:Auxin responsive SAUR protein [Artemisia annua]